METIKFNGIEYPVLQLNFPFGERTISIENLNENLMNVDGSYVSESAQVIDEKIFYFIDEKNLSLSKNDLIQLILSEI